MSSADQIEIELMAMIRLRAPGYGPIAGATALHHDLYISGDDANELLADVSERFGVSFADLDFKRYFPSEYASILTYLASKLGNRSKRPKLTVGHLLAVVERHHWFEPQSSNPSDVAG